MNENPAEQSAVAVAAAAAAVAVLASSNVSERVLRLQLVGGGVELNTSPTLQLSGSPWQARWRGADKRRGQLYHYVDKKTTDSGGRTQPAATCGRGDH